MLVCACVEHGVGVCVGGESCHEMAWGGMRGGPCPSIYSHGGANGHLGCFHVLASVNSAAGNTWLHVSF